MSKGENCKFGLVIAIQLLLVALVVCYYLYKRTMVLADTSRQLLSKSSQLISLTDEIYKYLHIHSKIVSSSNFLSTSYYQLFSSSLWGGEAENRLKLSEKLRGYKTV